MSEQTKELLEKVLALFKEADDERYKNQMEWHGEAQKGKAEGDMYACNFHQGMDAGSNWTALFYYRVQRELEAIIKALPTLEEPVKFDESKGTSWTPTVTLERLLMKTRTSEPFALYSVDPNVLEGIVAELLDYRRSTMLNSIPKADHIMIQSCTVEE